MQLARARCRLYLEKLSRPPPPPLCSELDEEETLLGCDEFSSSPCNSAKLLSLAQSRGGGGLLIDRIRRCLSGGTDLYPLLCGVPPSLLGMEGKGLLGVEATHLAASDVIKERVKDMQRFNFYTISSRRFICF